MQIVVLGYMVRGPLGGMAWHHLQYVLGLRQLGHQVLFLEDSGDYPSCYNPLTFETTTNPLYGLHFTEKLFTRYQLHNSWAYFDAHTNQWYGCSKSQVAQFCASAGVVLNLSGINPERPWWSAIERRVLVDTDPVFTQVKHLTNPAAKQFALVHTHFATFGENIGTSRCSIPNDGLAWLPTRQPVCLTLWPTHHGANNQYWTTVMQWDSYKKQEYNGHSYGMKSETFADYITLPGRVPHQHFELALGSPTAPAAQLRQAGWLIADPLHKTLTPEAYQQFIANSVGEWSVAKHGYVVCNSGWFSERSVNYLASGKPVVVQDTGFAHLYPAGKGLIPFSNLDEAVEAIEKVMADYQVHCRIARQLAGEYFGYDSVLPALLNALT